LKTSKGSAERNRVGRLGEEIPQGLGKLRGMPRSELPELQEAEGAGARRELPLCIERASAKVIEEGSTQMWCPLDFRLPLSDLGRETKEGRGRFVGVALDLGAIGCRIGGVEGKRGTLGMSRIH
jgi:hypothetical protein